MRGAARRPDTGAGKDRPGLFERWFFPSALSVVVAVGLYRHLDPWSSEPTAPVTVPIPAPRRPED